MPIRCSIGERGDQSFHFRCGYNSIPTTRSTQKAVGVVVRSELRARASLDFFSKLDTRNGQLARHRRAEKPGAARRRFMYPEKEKQKGKSSSLRLRRCFFSRASCLVVVGPSCRTWVLYLCNHGSFRLASGGETLWANGPVFGHILTLRP